MRGKKVVVNTIFSLGEEVISVVCGFILPRLILSAFGSKYNGLTTSITQFLSCAVLLRSGIGGATRAALYKPLAENDHNEFNAIVKATDNFMKKIGIILGGLIIVFAAVYPFLVQNDFDWFFTFSLFIIIGASTFAESLFGITYLIVLQADQKLWVSALLKSICILLNTIVGVILINNDASIHFVKLGSAFVYVSYPTILGVYVRKYYDIDRSVEPDNKAIEQRWDAFWQQVAVFVMNNTDVIVLTVFSNMLEVSVYSIYGMVVSGLRRIITSSMLAVEAAFGNMITKNETAILDMNIRIVEMIMQSLCTVIYSCAALLILDFIRIYTQKINDVEYIKPVFAGILILAQYFNGVRLPYQLVVDAAGHYKQTKKGAIMEPVINIALSIIFVNIIGLVGVAIGTLAATVYRTLQYSIYMSKNIAKRNQFITLSRCLMSFAEFGIIYLIIMVLNIPIAVTYADWVMKAVLVCFVSILVTGALNYLFFRNDMKMTIRKLKTLL